MRKNIKFSLPLILMVLILIIISLMNPKATDWSPGYSKEEKKPYGSYILYRTLPEIFPGRNIYPSAYPVYNTLKDQKDFLNKNDFSAAYIFINNNFDPDKLDMKLLMDFVRRGNNAFISAGTFGKVFRDSLKISTSVSYSPGYAESNFIHDRLKKPAPYRLKNPSPSYYFSETDSSSALVLGLTPGNNPDFIKVKLGKGNFFLNSLPVAFTNYNLLDPHNADYAYKALSYLPEKSSVIYWDEHYKPNQEYYRDPLRFILSREALRWAYYILFASVVLYIIFAGRRRQRIIPVIKPQTNTTLEFVNTVGSLYYLQKDHKNIAEKKIVYFLDQLRNRYLIKTGEINSDTINKIAARSGETPERVKEIFTYIEKIKSSKNIKESELHNINTLIESFYKKAGFNG
ncbi:MAG: DUF4350 domain-containing protein [Bacillota bacterium]